MKLIIGLGNPGSQYQHTRHNVGFMLVDSLFTDWREEKKMKSLISNVRMFECSNVGVSNGTLSSVKGESPDPKYQHYNTTTLQHSILGIQPQTFMNLSGDAISTLVSFYKLDPRRDILVISDDIDMEFGKVRYRSEGSHGGQNGLRDIITKLGTNEFARIKIGIGRDDRYVVSDWVLSKLSESEKEIIETDVKTKVEEYITKWLCD